MKIDIVKQPFPLVFLTFALLAAVFTIRALSCPYSVEEASLTTSLLGMLVDSFAVGVPFVTVALSLCLVCVNSLLITRIITRYSVSVIRTFLPMVLFLIVSCGIFSPLHSPAANLACTFFISSSELLIRGFRRSLRFQEMFKSMFYLGVATLLYPPASTLSAASLIVMVVYKRSLREIVTGVGGYLMPMLMSTLCWWFAGYDFLYFPDSFFASLAMPSDLRFLEFVTDFDNINVMVSLALGLILLLCAIVVVIGTWASMRSRPQKINVHFMIMTVATAAMMLVPSANIFVMQFFGVECALMIHILFVKSRPAIGSVLYFIILGFSVLSNITFSLF